MCGTSTAIICNVFYDLEFFEFFLESRALTSFFFSSCNFGFSFYFVLGESQSAGTVFLVVKPVRLRR